MIQVSKYFQKIFRKHRQLFAMIAFMILKLYTSQSLRRPQKTRGLNRVKNRFCCLNVECGYLANIDHSEALYCIILGQNDLAHRCFHLVLGKHKIIAIGWHKIIMLDNQPSNGIKPFPSCFSLGRENFAIRRLSSFYRLRKWKQLAVLQWWSVTGLYFPAFYSNEVDTFI